MHRINDRYLCCQQKPALVLDCDADFDIQHDLEAKRMIADKVSAFVRFVRNDYDKMRSDANIIRNADVFRTAELEMYSSGRKPASVAFDRDARPEAVRRRKLVSAGCLHNVVSRFLFCFCKKTHCCCLLALGSDSPSSVCNIIICINEMVHAGGTHDAQFDEGS